MYYFTELYPQLFSVLLSLTTPGWGLGKFSCASLCISFPLLAPHSYWQYHHLPVFFSKWKFYVSVGTSYMWTSSQACPSDLVFSLSPLLLHKKAVFAAFLKDKPCKIPEVNMCGQAFVDRSGGFLLLELLECRVKRTRNFYARQTISILPLESSTLIQRQTFFPYLLKSFERWQWYLSFFPFSRPHSLALQRPTLLSLATQSVPVSLH